MKKKHRIRRGIQIQGGNTLLAGMSGFIVDLCQKVKLKLRCFGMIWVGILVYVLLGQKWELGGNLKVFTQEILIENEEMGRGMVGKCKVVQRFKTNKPVGFFSQVGHVGIHMKYLCLSSPYLSFYWANCSSWVIKLITVSAKVTYFPLRASGKDKAFLNLLMNSLGTGVSTESA